MNGFRHISALFLLALLCQSCEPERSIEEQRADFVMIDAIIKSGESIDQIHVRSLTHMGESSGISDLDVYLRTEDENFKLTEHPTQAGRYYYEDRFKLIKEDTEYRFSLSYKDEVVSAVTVPPPTISELTLTANTIDANGDNETIWLDWKGINTGSAANYFYIVKITPVDTGEPLVPIDQKCLSCEKAVGDVLLNSDTELRIEDFNYYGEHLIEIFAISNDYKDYFFSQTNLAQNGLSNVNNGTGFFLGVSVLSDFITVE